MLGTKTTGCLVWLHQVAIGTQTLESSDGWDCPGFVCGTAATDILASAEYSTPHRSLVLATLIQSPFLPDFAIATNVGLTENGLKAHNGDGDQDGDDNERGGDCCRLEV